MKPLTQPFKWLGSKCRMRGRLLEIINTIPRKLYVEPFGGSGAMFFGKEPENSVYNDLNGLLTNFFRKIRSEKDRAIIQEIASYTPANFDYWHEFKDVCKAYLAQDEERLKQTLAMANLAEYDVEIAVAFAFFYCQSHAFSGSILHSFGEWLKPRGNVQYATSIALFEEYAKRLAYTTITKRDFRECIAKHDDKDTLFYCDPPYECNSSGDYKQGWTSQDTADLVRILCDAQGSVVLSCYDCELYRPLLDAGYTKRDFSFSSNVRRLQDDSPSAARVETVYFRNVNSTTNKTTLF